MFTFETIDGHQHVAEMLESNFLEIVWSTDEDLYSALDEGNLCAAMCGELRMINCVKALDGEYTGIPKWVSGGKKSYLTYGFEESDATLGGFRDDWDVAEIMIDKRLFLFNGRTMEPIQLTDVVHKVS